MGLLTEVLEGVLGSRAGARSGGSMSPIAMAALALVANQVLGGSRSAPGTAAANQGGGLTDLLRNLGGAAGGAVPGGLAGGLGGLLEKFQQAGLGDVARSWVGNGQNQPVGPDQLGGALGPETVDHLTQQTGMNREDLLAQLAQALPQIIDRLTPNGRLPTQDELKHY